MHRFKPGLFVIAACLTITSHSTAEDKCDCATETAPASASEAVEHKYPTAVITDYVLGCMAANGNSVESLHQCSCSIDFIKEKMSFTDFEEAQTIMQVQLDRGQRGIFFRDSNWAKERIKNLQKYQAESTLLCF